MRGWRGRGVGLPRQQAASGQEAAEVTELPGPGPRQAVWVKIRDVSFGP